MPSAPATDQPFLEILAGLGVHFDRVRYPPAPGTATFEDWQTVYESGIRCELVNGTLVDKAGWEPEPNYALQLIGHLAEAAIPKRLGITTGQRGFQRLFGDSVPAPHVSFIGRDRLPSEWQPSQATKSLKPDLVVDSNASSLGAEQLISDRKTRFGEDLTHWIVDVPTQTVMARPLKRQWKTFTDRDELPMPSILNPVRLTVAELFTKRSIL